VESLFWHLLGVKSLFMCFSIGDLLFIVLIVQWNRGGEVNDPLAGIYRVINYGTSTENITVFFPIFE